MIKIEKDLEQVPKSLNSDLTQQRRQELIESGSYINEGKYNSRYKMKDIKQALGKLYHYKCSYCEKDVSDSYFHIEHFRPKSKYHWLAYSWDNLMISCETCNQEKKDNFVFEGESISFDQNDLEHIHKLRDKYFEIQKPKFIHPEMEDIEADLIFSEKGEVDSNNPRVKHTIETCKLDRVNLTANRKKLFDQFLKQYKANARKFQTTRNQKYIDIIKFLISSFIKESKNARNEYLAFRRWLVKNTKYFKSA